MDETWFRERMSRLQITEDSLPALAELREKLKQLNADEISEAAANHVVPLSTVFACCEVKPSERSDVACDILALCLANLDLNKKENNLLLLEDMIRHRNESVQAIALAELDRIVRKKPTTVQSTTLVVDMIKCLSSESTTVGVAAMKVLHNVLDRHLDNAEVKSALEAVATSRAVSKCRLYELLANFAKTSADRLTKVNFILDHVVAELEHDDVLLQLNIMEILSDLVATDHGLAYLEEHGLFPRLMATLEDIDRMNILFPGFNKFFGSVAHAHPEKIFSKYSHLCKPLFETIISNDSETLSPSLDTLGLLALRKEGKIALSNLSHVSGDDDMRMVVMEMAMFLEMLPTSEKIRVLQCLEMIFRWGPLPPTTGASADEQQAAGCEEEVPDNRIETITQHWYRCLDRSDKTGLGLLLEFCRNPFPDIKLAAMSVLKAITAYKWGRKALGQTGGLMEYLCDRAIEFRPEVLHMKFEILQILDRHGKEELAETQYKDVAEYVAKGPFYKKGIHDVEMMSNQ